MSAGLVGMLALTACGGSADDSSSGPDKTAAPTSTADTGGGTGGTGDVTSSSGKLQGSWLATTGGKAVALVITDKQAGLFATGGTVCSGTAGEQSGMQMIHLTCTDGSKDRGTGMVDSISGNSMKVTWSGKTGKETYTKAAGGKLPSGLPTAKPAG